MPLAGLANYRVKRDWRREEQAGEQREIRAEGYCPFSVMGLANEDFPGDATAIRLVTEMRSHRGSTIPIVGTTTHLYRYMGAEEEYADDYVEDDYVANPTWMEIGSGFSASGKRWEAVQVGDYLVLNNETDLVLTYHEHDGEAKPIHELREQGIAKVGTIAEHLGILVLADITDIDDHETLMARVSLSGTCSQAGPTQAGAGVVNSGVSGVPGNRLTATAAIFDLSYIGKTIRMTNGLQRVITGILGASPSTAVLLDGDPDLSEPTQPFWVLGPDDNLLSEPATDLGSSPADYVGSHIVWDGGYTRKIISVDSNQIRVDDDRAIPAGTWTVENPLAYAPHAGDYRRGYRMLWSMNNDPRRFAAALPCTINRASNVVELDYPCRSLIRPGDEILILAAGVAGGNLSATITYVDAAGAFLTVAGDISEANAAAIAALEIATTRATEAQDAVTLATATVLDAEESLEAARLAEEDAPLGASAAQLAELAAGVATAAAALDQALTVKTSTETTYSTAEAARVAAAEAVEDLDTDIMLADALGSIAEVFEDLADDASAIIRMGSLQGYLVCYKGTHIILGKYTGSATAPFRFERAYHPKPGQDPMTVHFKHSLLDVDGRFHFYVGEHDFYQFELTSRKPVPMKGTDGARDLFFRAAQQDSDEIWSAHCPPTREIWLAFPSSTDDKAIRFHYPTGSAATTSGQYTAAQCIQQPNGSLDWFVMGLSNGTLVRYGKLTAQPRHSGTITGNKLGLETKVTASAEIFALEHVGWSVVFADGTTVGITGYVSPTEVTVVGSGRAYHQAFTLVPAIWHRNGQGYTSVLRSGLDFLQKPNMYKRVDGYDLLLSPISLSTVALPQAPVTLKLRVAERLDQEAETEIQLLKPFEDWQVETLLDGILFGDELSVSGMNNPVEYLGKTLNLGL